MTVARTIRHVDAFTSTPLEGNPAAVVDGAGLDTDTMQRIALNQHLSETVFLLPPQSAANHAHIRIFTPGTELPFAGHPTLAAAHTLISEGTIRLAPAESLRLETGAGVIPVEVTSGEPTLYTMTQASPQFRPSDSTTDIIAAGLGLAPRDVILAERVSTGIYWLIAQIASLEAMLRVVPDMMALLKIPHGISIFCIGAQTAGADVHVRSFAPEAGVFEDPVTGSSNGCIAALIAKHALIPARDGEIRYVAEQGLEMGQPGRVYARVTGMPEAISVRIGGHAVTVLRGELLLPRLMLIAAILLAAGGAAIDGVPLALLPWGHDSTLIEYEIAELQAAGIDVIEVVLGFEAERIIPLVSGNDVEPIVDPRWQTGEPSWLRVGASAVPRNTEAAIIARVSEPRSASVYIRLLEEQSSTRAAIARAGAHAGPIVIDAATLAAVRNVSDGGGLDAIIAHVGDAVAPLDVDPGELVKIGTSADYQRALALRAPQTVIRKAFAYVTHSDRLLIFSHPLEPAAGLQVPAGSMLDAEAPADAALREALEETGLTDLRVVRFLGDIRRDMSDRGRAEIHHRFFYHLVCESEPPETWQHYEPDPSDGSEPPLFEFRWVPLPDGVPDLIVGHGALLPALIAAMNSPGEP